MKIPKTPTTTPDPVPSTIPVPTSLVQALVTYLSRHPWADANPLIQGLAQAAQAATPPPDSTT